MTCPFWYLERVLKIQVSGGVTLLLSKMLLTLQRILVLSYSGSSILWWLDHEEKVTMALWNNRKYSPNDKVSHLTGPHFSSTPLWKIWILHRICSGSYIFPFLAVELQKQLINWIWYRYYQSLDCLKPKNGHMLTELAHLLSSCPLNMEKPRTASSSVGCITGLLNECWSRRDCWVICFCSLQQP